MKSLGLSLAGIKAVREHLIDPMSYTEGIAEGRRLEREEMRCESCKYWDKLKENSQWGICGNDEAVECRCGDTDSLRIFGCRHHEERRKE